MKLGSEAKALGIGFLNNNGVYTDLLVRQVSFLSSIDWKE